MKFRLIWEKHGPKILAIVTFVLFFKYGACFYKFALLENWNVPSVYSSIFDLMSIITAFVFSFFTFARTSETEFLFEMRKTKTYRRFMKYLITAMWSSALVVVTSVPFMIAQPQPTQSEGIWFWVSAIWVSLVVFSGAATVRSMRQFVAIAMVEKDE